MKKGYRNHFFEEGLELLFYVVHVLLVAVKIITKN